MAGVVVGAVLGTVAVVQANKNANKARQVQEKALEEQRKSNEKAIQRQEEEIERTEQQYNRANQKRAEIEKTVDESELSAQEGAGGTLLTGPSGVDPNTLNLSKNTLLGG